jgi:superfamily II DNA/RNA helicase/cold shock CspA family protein
LTRQGITEPLIIQSETIPPALAGKDICGKAPTGSGKTLAFGIPLVLNATQSRPRRPRALVLVPTRELASQVHEVIGDLLGHDSKRVVSIFGGTGYRDQVRALHKGVNIVVACPGRLEDLIERGDVRLEDVSTVVLDEADRMADMGFLPAVRRLLDQTAPNRQVLLFSATIGREVESVIRNYQHDPVRIAIEATEEAKGDVAHHFWKVDRAERVAITAKLIAHHGQAFVFCRTKRGADRVVKQLQAHGVRAVPMHGDRTQGQRERALDSFAKGKADALVATDVVARGIHVDALPCVVHFDPPTDHVDYVHRSGRTGRAGNTGTVVSLVTPEQHKDVRGVQNALGLEPGLLAPFSAPMPVPSAGNGGSPKARNGGVPKARNGGSPRPRKLTGTVKFFNSSRGYGFVEYKGGDDLFVHHSQVEGDARNGIAPGSTVEFNIGAGRRGNEAHNVKVL